MRLLSRSDSWSVGREIQMELSEAIVNRRSIRKYKRDPIPDALITEILNSGMAAPSAGNLQSRHFYVVRDRALMKSLAAAALDQTFIAEASVVVVVCTDHKIRAEYGDRGENLYAIMDCAASIQNMLLTAHSLRLGACWVGAYNEKAVSKILNMPDRFRPVAIIPFGYPAETPGPPHKVAFDAACEFL
jgi:nitroreductase